MSETHIAAVERSTETAGTETASATEAARPASVEQTVEASRAAEAAGAAEVVRTAEAGRTTATAHAAVARTAVVDGAPGPAVSAVTDALTRLGVRVCLRSGEPGGEPGDIDEPVPDLYCAVLTGNDAYRSNASPNRLDRRRAADVAAAMAARGTGRLVLITDNGSCLHLGGTADLAADRAGDQRWWQHLAASNAAPGVSINTVSLGYAPFLGHTLSTDVEAELFRHLPIRRAVTSADVQGALRLFVEGGCSYLVGETIPVDAGQDINLIAVPRDASRSTQGQEQAEPSGEQRLAGPGQHPAEPCPDAPEPRSCEPGQRLPDSGHRPVCLVVGASSGIGRAVALDLAAGGVDLVLASRRVEALREVATQAEDLGARTWVLPCDVGDHAQIGDLVAQAVGAAGRIERAVYAAGNLSFGHAPAGTGQTFAVNLFGYMTLCERLTAYWREHAIAGSIVGVSSVSNESVPVTNVEEYGASKAAMTQFSRCLAATVARDGIRVNCVCPGIIRTPMGQVAGPAVQRGWVARIPAGRVGEPQDVAPLITWLLSDDAALVTGARLRVDGGFGLGGLPPLVPPAAVSRPPGGHEDKEAHR